MIITVDSHNGIRQIPSTVKIVFVIGINLIGFKISRHISAMLQAPVIFKAATDDGRQKQGTEHSTVSQQTALMICCPGIIHLLSISKVALNYKPIARFEEQVMNNGRTLAI